MNVFRKENRRRVLFTLTLILLAAVLSFGFVSRAVEYLAVRQELERLSDNYRTIGWLTSGDGRIAEGAELIDASPYVETADRRGNLWGVLTNLYNADLQGRREGWVTNEYGVNNAEVLFWGTLRYVDEDWKERENYGSSVQKPAYRLVFTVSERISGYPDYAEEGGSVNLVITYDKMESEGWELPELAVGERYLIRGCYSGDRNGLWPGYESWAKGVAGYALTALPVQGNSLIMREEEGREALFVLGADERMQLDELNRHAMNVIATRDMSAMPAAQDVSKRMFLTEGRWLDGIDNNTGAEVCAVHKDFADARGLHIGDEVELTFRCPQTQLYAYAIGEQDLSDWQSYESETRQYTIVGIFDYMPMNEAVHNHSVENLELYIPYGSAPEAYIRDMGFASQNFSFVLRNPQDTDAFLNEVQEALAAMGMKIQLIENDWEHFAVSADAMERTARSGMLVFSGVLCLGFILIAFLYGRQNTKSIGIARALGVSKKKSIRMCIIPMLSMSVIGVGAGALLSWRYALGKAEQMLTGMQEHTEMSLSVWWLMGFILVPAILLTAAAAIGILITARRPIMELLRDTAARTAREIECEDRLRAEDGYGGTGKQAEKNNPVTGNGSMSGQISLPMGEGKGKGTASVCRFVWRHIVRKPVHTTLMIMVALAFLMAVTWMQVSIVMNTAEVERLYETTEIAGELVKRDTAVTSGFGGGFLTQSMVDWLDESGYVRSLYTEAADEAVVERIVIQAVTGEVIIHQNMGTDIPVRSTVDIERFCEENKVEIDYADGYGAELFMHDWISVKTESGTARAFEHDLPVIVPRAWLEKYELKYGQSLSVMLSNGASTSFRIAGSVEYADYGDGIGRGVWEKILIPMSAVKGLRGNDGCIYSCIRFTVNPAFNRELDRTKEEIADQLQSTRMALLDADVMLWTGELRRVVEPFEKNLDLMKLLFPVTVAVSVIAGGGLIFLLLLQRTEEAALLRVLGNSRARTRRMLLSEPVVLSLFGLLVGIAAVSYGLPEVSVGQILTFAGAYLGGCVLGAVLGTVHITRKMPLELLQVKE